MKYKILLSLLVVSVLGCGRSFHVNTDTLSDELYGKTRQEIKALYGTPTGVSKSIDGDYQYWYYNARWVDEVSGYAFKSCTIVFKLKYTDEDKKELLRVLKVNFRNTEYSDDPSNRKKSTNDKHVDQIITDALK